jgi:hypothetical protein|tara:strand:+ start:5854 stop:6669 length:816 start_codon:yes stop_codon:yes gene_type:complete
MAVKFSQFNLASTLSDIDYLVGFKSTNNIQIPVGLVAVNTTYTVATAQSGSNETLTLTGSDASTDVITFTAGNDITLTDDGAGNGFTIASTASGDTYTLAAGTKAGTSVPLNLDAAAGSDSTVNLTEGSGITLTQTSATEITIASAAGDTYDLNATADGSNVDLNLTSGSGTDNSTVQFTAGTGMTLTRTGAQEVTFASAAGVTMTTSPAATGNGSTATYPLGATPTDENFTMAYISGVYQLKSSYTVSGSNITFDTNVPNGASIEIVTTT